MKPRRFKTGLLVLTLLPLCMAGTLIAMFIAPNGVSLLFAAVSDRSPNEAIRFVERRLIGHDKLQGLVTPALKAFQRRLEKPTGEGRMATLGKGQQTAGLAGVRRVAADVVVANAEKLLLAIRDAQPGVTIEVVPGIYRFANKIQLGSPGTNAFPVTLRAAIPGTSILEFTSEEGFLVAQPYWVFEGLVVRGTCSQDHDCEHAFHVVGAGHHTTIRNNYLENFNAHIKVNGLDGNWPDHGLVSFNTLTNTHPRQTARPVTPFDLVGSSYWQVQDNLVTNFVKRGGTNVSFGIFMKGASEGGRIERNLVICSPSEISQPGARVGISFGGGGSFPQNICRNASCDRFEHSGGLAASNIVAHCNDSGIDVNHSVQTVLTHNTLINTSGIDVRRSPSSARIHGNLLEGGIRARDGAQINEGINQNSRASSLFSDPTRLNLGWKNLPDVTSTIPLGSKDFCGIPRPSPASMGAFGNLEACTPNHSKPEFK